MDCPALTDKLISVWFSNELPLTKGRRGRSLVCLRRRKLPRSFCREARELDSGQCPESPTQNNFCRYRQSYRCCKKPLAIVLEPAGRNTAPAAAIAALMLIKTDPNALVLLLPSDHKIADKKAFQKAASIAAQATADNYLVTFGVKPDRPETGYGYIHRGPPLKGHGGCFTVVEFVEKPDRSTAAQYLATGNYDWNSGMFLFSAKAFLEELERLEPEIVNACRASIDGAKTDLDFVRISEQAFSACPSKSIDYAVMEHTKHAAMIPVEIG